MSSVEIRFSLDERGDTPGAPGDWSPEALANVAGPQANAAHCPCPMPGGQVDTAYPRTEGVRVPLYELPTTEELHAPLGFRGFPTRRAEQAPQTAQGAPHES